MKKYLEKLYQGDKLDYDQAYEIMSGIGQAKYNSEQLASFLTVFNMRSIKPNELLGFRDALLEMSKKVSLPKKAIDIVGTGGDGKDTFNISTLSCFIVAGAGYKVVKHGNYSASSVTGSSHMMEYFGYQFSNNEEKLIQDLDKANICFLHAPLFHPAMKNIVSVRKALQLRTIFNIMGPLINPAKPDYALYGTYNRRIADLYHQTLKETNLNYTIITSKDGYDEVSLTSDVIMFNKSSIEHLRPEDFGLNHVEANDLRGGRTIEENALIFKSILEGNASKEKNNVVIANAALAIQCFDKEKSLKNCVAEAKQALENKKALECLNNLIKHQP